MAAYQRLGAASDYRRYGGWNGKSGWRGVEFDEEFARWGAADERPATVGGPYKSKSNPRGRGESRPYKG